MNNKLYDKDVLEAIGPVLIAKKQTLSVAESVTSGFLQAAISAIPDASQFYQGGITAYNVAQKYRHLMVEPIHALATNCVSEQVSREMALHVCNQFNSDWGLAVTGYASPVPESGHELFAYYAISFQQSIVDTGRITPPGKESVEAQLYYVNEVLRRWLSRL
jgi:PncC family amidohydrolase